MRRTTTITLILAILLVAPALAPAAASGQPAETEPTTEAVANLTGVASVATGYYHSCAVMANSRLRCWGYNENGQLGTGATSANELEPVTVRNAAGTGPLTNVAAVTLGEYHTCALLTNRQVRCWGAGEDGQLGNGARQSSSLPVPVKNVAGTARLGDVGHVSASNGTTCARLRNGQARCWGRNTDGHLGAGSLSSYSSLPVKVLAVSGSGALTGVTQVNVGQFSACARLTNGQARCWGHNGAGQLGDGTEDTRLRPVVVENGAGSGPLTGVRRVDVGAYHSCAVMVNGTARCWGENDDGQLGEGSEDDATLPVVVRNQTDTGALAGVASVAAGYYHSCARLTDGQARCWGLNGDGQIGNGNLAGPDVRLPTPVLNRLATGHLVTVTQLHTGDFHACARLRNGQARCWGYGEEGQLGDGGQADRALPVAVLAPSLS